MESPISNVCFVGVYGNHQNEVLRDGLAEHDVDVRNAGLSTRDTSLCVAGWSVPFYPMKPTLNWFSRYPSVFFPLLFFTAFALHACVTWTLLLANVGKVRRSDILVVPHLGDTSVLLVKPFAILFGKPVVYISHNGLYCTLVENRGVFVEESVAARLLYRVDAAIQSLADQTVVFSHHSKTVLSNWFGVPEERYEVVYIGVDERKFGDADLNRSPDVDVLYWGNFIPHHGVETMVDAAASLPEHEFVFAGLSEQRGTIMDRTDRRGAENVRFPGFLSNAELEAHIQAADIVLGPLGDYTQTQMNIGTKVAEAAYLGKVIVLGDHPAPNEVFDHRESAFLVEPEDDAALVDGIEEVLTDADLQARLERQSREVCEAHFFPEQVAAQFLDAANATSAA